MDCVVDLVETGATVIRLGSAFHADMSGPNLTMRPMPDPDAGAELTESDFLASVTPVTEALVFMSISSGPLRLMGTEVYPGQRPDTE